MLIDLHCLPAYSTPPNPTALLRLRPSVCVVLRRRRSHGGAVSQGGPSGYALTVSAAATAAAQVSGGMLAIELLDIVLG